ncbi:ABC transporter permease [Longispora sp. K20-0274]|uniref:ABC transporter permease n=1 Tax=Longispora sp. K20-0274 TaxID=3088255 RepID=UPI00399B2A50
MIWLTWRQFRTQAAVVYAALVVLAATLAVTGPGLARDYDAGLASCAAHGGCTSFTDQFLKSHFTVYVGLCAVVVLLPAIVGLFWGAPLVAREFEAGTHRLAWNQSVTRTRWLGVKLGLIGLAVMVAAAVTSAAVTWWSAPLDKVAATIGMPRLSPEVFVARDLAPVGYALFAFALGVTVGILVRRTLPAIAITLVVFAAVQLAVPTLVRPYLLPATVATVEISPANLDGLRIDGDNKLSVTALAVDGAWTLSNETVDATGHVVANLPASVAAACMPTGLPTAEDRGIPRQCFEAIAQGGYRQRLTYQPASRYWAFQWGETALFVALALGLAGFSFRRIRRRRQS